MEKSKDNTKLTILCKFLILMIIGGIFGFIYEEIFYRIDLGLWIKRGTSVGPWVPIYGFGAVMLVLLNKKIKDKPWLVFLVSVVATGIMEFICGYVLLHVFNTRLWDYNTEIWNWGNINGYICLRSVLFFGISALLLMYLIYPAIERVFTKFKGKKLNIIAIILGFIYILDITLSFFIKFF